MWTAVNWNAGLAETNLKPVPLPLLFGSIFIPELYLNLMRTLRTAWQTYAMQTLQCR